MASTRSQARQGGKLPAVTQKPIGEMTLRELIAERSRGEPMQSARSKGKRKKADAAPGAGGASNLRPGMSEEERMAAEDEDVVANGPDLAPADGRHAAGGEEEASAAAAAAARREYQERSSREEVDGQVDGQGEKGWSPLAPEQERQLSAPPASQISTPSTEGQLSEASTSAAAGAIEIGPALLDDDALFGMME